MSDLPESFTRLAQIAAKKDHEEGGYRHGGWSVAFIAWAATARQDHRECGRLVPDLDEYVAGKTNTPAVICPVHGRLEGPEMPGRQS